MSIAAAAGEAASAAAAAAAKKRAHAVMSGLSAGAGAYGIYLGTAAQPRRITSADDAQTTGNLTHFGLKAGRDMAFAAADDVAGLLFLRSGFFKRRFSQYQTLANLGANALMIGGTATAGTVLGHDYMNFVAAKEYLANHNGLTQSQEMIPDPRMGAISGFNNHSPGALQRMQMTGIGSPAAGGIFYRMQNNPFANTLQDAIIEPDKRNPGDPRAKALGMSWIGGLAGMALGMRGGLARATIMGLAGGTIAGSYGVYSAHNPDMRQNLRAYGDIALGAAPTAVVGGLLYGLSSGRLGKFGKAMDGYLKRATDYAGTAGVKMSKASNKLHGAMGGWHEPAVRAGHWLGDPIDRMLFKESTGKWLPHDIRAGERIGNAFQSGIGLGQSANSLFNEQVAHMFIATGQHEKRWERSLGIGHLATIVPHQAVVVATGLGIYQGHHKSKSTSTMPSNRKRS